MTKKILVITEMFFGGSGYYNIAVPLFSGLAVDYEIRIVGLGYEGQEHPYPFSIIPARDLNDTFAIVHNLCSITQTSPDVIIVALDIPMQIQFREKFAQYKKPYIAITPLENPPLTMTWAAQLMTMNWVFFISEIGKDAAIKAGLRNVDHIQVGVDTDFWRIPTDEEKKQIRRGMDIADDEFVILTVADNQERKNLWAALSVTAELKKMGKKIRHVLVTRVDTPFGWKIRDLAMSLGINQELMTMNRGMSLDNLWGLYAMSDCFLLSSKAEGLGMPVLEAMSCGLPVVATDTGAITELLQDNRGCLIPSEYDFIDVWGNSKRSMMNIKEAAMTIATLKVDTGPARQYVEGRKWFIAVQQVKDKIEEITNEQK